LTKLEHKNGTSRGVDPWEGAIVSFYPPDLHVKFREKKFSRGIAPILNWGRHTRPRPISHSTPRGLQPFIVCPQNKFGLTLLGANDRDELHRLSPWSTRIWAVLQISFHASGVNLHQRWESS